MTQDDLRLTLEGTCQVCERTLKIRGEPLAIVHHGYERPGDGRIHGDCFAVGMPPYEFSCDGTRKFRALVAERIANRQDYLQRLRGGEVREITETHLWRPSGQRVSEYVLGVTEPYTWSDAFNRRVRESEFQVKMDEGIVHRMDQLIAEWRPRSLQEVMEAKQAVVRVEREQRAAERSAARAVKLEKAKALTAKRVALEEARAKIRKEFAEAFTALAAQEPSPRRTADTWRLIDKLRLKKHSWLDVHDLNCDDALVQLGLARVEAGLTSARSGRTYVRYTY